MLHEEDVSQVKNGGTQTDYEIIAPKPTMMPAVWYDARESHNEILRAIESIIREKDALIQELSFKIGRMEWDLINSVSKLEHKKTLLALEDSSHNRIHDMDMLARARDELEKKFQKERFISTCLLIGVFALLVACAFLMFHFFSLRETIIQNI